MNHIVEKGSIPMDDILEWDINKIADFDIEENSTTELLSYCKNKWWQWIKTTEDENYINSLIKLIDKKEKIIIDRTSVESQP